MFKFFTICCLTFVLFSCHSVKQLNKGISGADTGDSLKGRTRLPGYAPRTDAFLEGLLARHTEWFKEIMDNRQERNVQIIYTQIDRKPNNLPIFTPFYFNVSPQYFYPASTVKMPVALLSLEKLGGLKSLGVTMNSPMLTGADGGAQTPVLNDPTTPDGVPTIAQYIRKIFLVSDNEAYNRLYEFLGQESINKSLHEKGYGSTNIYHRLSVALEEGENRLTNPLKFTDSLGRVLYRQPLAVSRLQYATRKDSVGRTFIHDGQLILRPMDFSRKNRFNLEDLTKVLRAILFPESLPYAERFHIGEEGYQLVRKFMSGFPGESISPEYPKPQYWDAYCKFLYYGADPKALLKPQSFRIFNKVGDAYGFLTDIAYFVDFEAGIEFMLSATIYCNSDGVLNDDKYDYDSIGYPFMQHLGQAVYEFELGRGRKVKPDLSAFRFIYDK